MKQKLVKFDWVIIGVISILTIFSLLINKFLIPDLFLQQLFYIFLGILFFFLFSQIDFSFWEKIRWLLYLGSLFFLLAAFLFGIESRGAVRWIKIGNYTLQPSELIKPFLLLFFASFLGSENLSFKKIVVSFFLLLFPVLLIFFQPDLGSSLIFVFSWLGILLGAGISFKAIIGSFFSAFFFFPWIWKFLLKDYQRERILTFLNPATDPLGKGYNLIQAKIAIGAGQFFGRGLGGGTQSQLKFLPEYHTDFIFASFAEEFGFLGVSILIFLFGLLLWRILQIGENSSKTTTLLFCEGVFCLIFIQTFVNIGMNLGLLPIAGVTLPLFSYGGSSFLAIMMMLGIVENICYNSSKNYHPFIDKGWMKL